MAAGRKEGKRRPRNQKPAWNGNFIHVLTSKNWSLLKLKRKPGEHTAQTLPVPIEETVQRCEASPLMREG